MLPAISGDAPVSAWHIPSTAVHAVKPTLARRLSAAEPGGGNGGGSGGDGGSKSSMSGSGVVTLSSGPSYQFQ